MASHPTRVRGLKPQYIHTHIRGLVSHPTRVRGLKRLAYLDVCQTWFAPHTGAWIETAIQEKTFVLSHSHPTRVRGLKHRVTAKTTQTLFAPHTGAWIETYALL